MGRRGNLAVFESSNISETGEVTSIKIGVIQSFCDTFCDSVIQSIIQSLSSSDTLLNQEMNSCNKEINNFKYKYKKLIHNNRRQTQF